jgi:hypothetical protein
MIGAASVLAAGALVGVGAQGAFAATSDNGTPGPGDATATIARLGSPAADHGSAIGALVKQVGEDLLSGHINGAKARSLAKKIVGDKPLFSLLPSSLQDDLTTLKNAGVHERTADAKKIVSTALSGGYGSAIQALATQLKDARGQESGVKGLLEGLTDGSGLTGSGLAGSSLAGSDLSGSGIGDAAGLVASDLSASALGADGARIAATVTSDTELAAALPAALRADLSTLANASASDQNGDVQHIVTTAIDGGYGSQIQQLADQIEHVVVSGD